LGDPADKTNVAYYPEISSLPKLKAGEVAGNNSETHLETLRADPVATHLGENVSVVQTNFDDSAWRQLNLPHDWAVELPFNSSADNSHGSKPVGNARFGTNNIGWYRHSFMLPSNDAGQTLWLEFDGVYRNCLVWLNGHILGRNVSGYGGFSFDIRQYANLGGTNVLVVRVDASRFEGWFYEGAGIYRHVWLVKTAPVHVAHWGTYVASTVSNSNATVTVQTQVNNDNTNSAANGSLTSTIVDPNGNAVATATQGVTIAPGANLVVTQTLQVMNAQLWSLQSPTLYQAVSTVTQGGATNDTYQTPFGIRTIQFDPNLGLFLNGQHVLIQGTCNHQDHAGVGSALPDRLQYYRIERLKEMGCNVYRTSHNPPTPELLDACDRLGMLMLDESRRFGTNAETLGELQSLILRDRNHPSVFCWSMCNEEIYLERDNGAGASIMRGMVNLVHQLDPSRKCTAAMDNYSSGAADGFSSALDVQGFNYMNHGSMDGFHNASPNLPVFGTEEASTVFTRGIYAHTSTYLPAYDINVPGSYATTAEGWWQYYTAHPWCTGACVWTGFDYRGEPTPFRWPNISSQFGAMDTCGFSKDVFYYYQANWTGKGVLHIFPHWNWAGKEGQPINIWCYSDCAAVELFLNGASQGMKTVNVQSHVEWNVPYAAGTLQAVGYRNGRAVMTNTIATTGVPAGILLQPDRRTILADGRDVSVVNVAVVDAQGNVVPTAANRIDFMLNGGVIIGVGNGDPASHEADKPVSPTSSVRSVFNGWAQLIVQSTRQAGTITLTAKATGLASTNVSIAAARSLPPPTAPIHLQAAAGNGQIWVNWDEVPGAISYHVKRSTTSGGSYTTVAGATPNSFFTDTGLTNGTAYYYLISAVDLNGEGKDSVEVSATPLPLPLPAAPANLKAVPVSSAQISLSWNASAAATSYIVKRSTTKGGRNTLVGTTTNTTFVDAGLTNTIVYYYVVSATSSVGESTNSLPASVRPGPPLPVAWFAATALTNLATGSRVAGWTDLSGNLNHAVNATATQQPVYIPGAMNGKPVVRFNAVNRTYLAFDRVVQDDFTICCVFQSRQGQDTGTNFWQGAGLVSGEVQGPQNDFGTSLNVDGKILAGAGGASDTTAVSATGFNDGRPHLLTYKRVKLSGLLQLYADGTLVATITGDTVSLTAPPQLVLGAQQTLNNFLTGDIAEVKVFNSALLDADRASVEGPLLANYGVGSTNASLSGSVIPVTNINATHDMRVFLTDLGSLTFATANGTHPTAAGHQTIYQAALPVFDPIITRH